jgi:hypothetical protein
MIIISNQNSPEILQPRKQALDLPSPFVAPQLSAVLRFGALSIGFARDQLGFKFQSINKIPGFFDILKLRLSECHQTNFPGKNASVFVRYKTSEKSGFV